MRPLTLDSLNQQLQTVQYAVRGELAIKAETYRDQLKSGGHNLPFDKVISSNIGNPQQKGLDQPPITFTRQVGSPFLTSYNDL
jgi:alanine transaminase